MISLGQPPVGTVRNLESAGTPVAPGGFHTINFVGGGVTDAGGGVADVPSSAAVTLQSAYDGGPSVTLGAGGAITVTKSAVDATNALEVTVSAGTGLAALFSGASISVPGTSGTDSERFGLGADVVANRGTAIGAGSDVDQADSVALGWHAYTGGPPKTFSIAIGSGASSASSAGTIVGGGATIDGSSDGATIVGRSGTVTGSFEAVGVGIGNTISSSFRAIILGANTSATGAVGSIVVGNGSTTTAGNNIIFGPLSTSAFADSLLIAQNGATTAVNQAVIGSVTTPYNDFYLGGGVVSATPTGVILHATGGSGANIAGASFTVIGGASTGTGFGGSLLFQTTPAGLAGSSANAPVTALTIDSTTLATFAGDVSIAGKLTVTGAIDPPSLSLSGGTALFIDSADGSTAPVSAVNHGRIRYLDGVGWQVSSSGGAYATISTGGASSLSSVLAIGNTTGAHSILTTAGNAISSTNTTLQFGDSSNPLVAIRPGNGLTAAAPSATVTYRGTDSTTGGTPGSALVFATGVGGSAGTAATTIKFQNCWVSGAGTTLADALVVEAAGSVYCPGVTGAVTETRFGSGSIVTGNNSSGFGKGVSVSGAQCAVFGESANGDTGSFQCIFGQAASGGTFTGANAFGRQTIITGDYGVALGYQASAGTHQFVVGSTTGYISDVYFGNGSTNATPQSVVIHATSGAAATNNGANLTLFAGAGLTTGTGGALNLFGASGTPGGDVTLQAGRHNTNGAGGITGVFGADGGVTGGAGGTTTLRGGHAQTGNEIGGQLTGQGGNGVGTGHGGDLLFQGGPGGATGAVGGTNTWASGDASGSDTPGSNNYIFGGRPRGNQNGGKIILGTAPSGGSGTTLQAIINQWAILASGKLQGNSANILGFTASSSDPTGSADTGYSRLAANSHAFGNGTASDVSGTLNFSTSVMTGLAAKYNNITTTGWGHGAIYGTGRSTAQTAAVATVATYTVGASDGSFLISANVNITTSTLYSFVVTVTYTDETSSSITSNLVFTLIDGTVLSTIANAGGTGPREGIPMRIRCKAGTTITVATSGTFTTVTYNVESDITQVS